MGTDRLWCGEGKDPAAAPPYVPFSTVGGRRCKHPQKTTGSRGGALPTTEPQQGHMCSSHVQTEQVGRARVRCRAQEVMEADSPALGEAPTCPSICLHV